MVDDEHVLEIFGWEEQVMESDKRRRHAGRISKQRAIKQPDKHLQRVQQARGPGPELHNHLLVQRISQ